MNKVSGTPDDKKPFEFSKILAIWAIILATLSVIASYVFAFLGLNPISEVTNKVFDGCVYYLIAYATKSLGEKISRNFNHLDPYGYPLDRVIINPEGIPVEEEDNIFKDSEDSSIEEEDSTGEGR